MLFVIHLPTLCGVLINKSIELKNFNIRFLVNANCIIILKNVFFSGKITRYIVGNIFAFSSGLFFTANNFVIKGARLSFGEVLAVRSIIQNPLMVFLLLFRGMIEVNFELLIPYSNYPIQEVNSFIVQNF